jgi:hypothetical protein
MSHRLRRRPSAAMVVALLALFVALDGPATAARLVDGKSIKRNSITSTQIRNRTIGTHDLSKTALKTLQRTPSSSVGPKQLRDGAVGTRALSAKAVDATKILEGAVGTSAVAPKAIDATKLGDAAVGPNQIAADAVTPSKIADGAVGAAAIADGGLQTRDLGDFYGSVSINFGEFAPNTCQFAPVVQPQPSSPGAGSVIGDDVISVSAAPGWPDPIVVQGNPGAGNTLRIVACRVGQDPTKSAGVTDVIDPGPTTFQYVAFDAP